MDDDKLYVIAKTIIRIQINDIDSTLVDDLYPDLSYEEITKILTFVHEIGSEFR